MRSASRRFAVNVAGLGLAAAALAGSYWCARFAYAEWLFAKDDPASVARAVQLVPVNSTYLARLADWDPPHRLELLKRAVSLDPYDFESLIQLGLHSEVHDHDVGQAERYYLRAAAVNRQYLPRVALANFYYRQRKQVDFFNWAQAALAITPYDPEPIFSEMWLLNDDPVRVARAVPDRPPVLRQYALYLTTLKVWDGIPPIIGRLISAVPATSRAEYLNDIGAVLDRIIEAGQVQPAFTIWTVLHRASCVPLPTPSADNPVTNGQFAVPAWQHGFDWQLLPSDGISVDQDTTDKSLSVTFNGYQPEHSTLLRQPIPLEPSTTYHLRCSISGSVGTLTWRLHPLQSSGEATLPDLSADSASDWIFRTTKGYSVALLSLEYLRRPGTVRNSSTETVRSVSIRRESYQ